MLREVAIGVPRPRAAILFLGVVGACAQIVGADFDKAHENRDTPETGGSGQGGNSGSAGGGQSTGGMQSPDGEAPGIPDASSAGGAPGSGGTNTGGSGGTSTGGRPSTGGAGGCVGQTWCRDGDGDDFGDPNEAQPSCDAPGTDWFTNCNDCDDDNAAVHPGAACSAVGYSPSSGAGPSYDYDCDGQETLCDAPILANPAGCGVVGALNCAGAGYLPSSQRTVTGNQNPYCGSTEWRNCISVGLPCVAQTVMQTAVACR